MGREIEPMYELPAEGWMQMQYCCFFGCSVALQAAACCIVTHSLFLFSVFVCFFIVKESSGSRGKSCRGNASWMGRGLPNTTLMAW
jgi:hypothetical protein